MFVDPVAIKARQKMLGEIETFISTTTPLPENRTARCLELLQTAKALTCDMLKRGNRIQRTDPCTDFLVVCQSENC